MKALLLAADLVHQAEHRAGELTERVHEILKAFEASNRETLTKEEIGDVQRLRRQAAGIRKQIEAFEASIDEKLCEEEVRQAAGEAGLFE